MGEVYQFTHKNPVNGEVWSDDIPVGKTYGAWVHPDEVEWI